MHPFKTLPSMEAFSKTLPSMEAFSPQERVDSLRRSELPLLLPARAERGRAERFGTPWVIKEVIL